jgi:hypothetical protein
MALLCIIMPMFQQHRTKLRIYLRTHSQRVLLIVSLCLCALPVWRQTLSGPGAPVLAQASPLSPVASPSVLAVAENTSSTASSPPVSLVLVAIVLVGILVVVGMVVWRRP